MALTLRRYDKHSLEACLEGGEFRRCRHEGCQSGQQCFPDEDSFMICRECHGLTCISCDVVWHPNESCAKVRTRRNASRNAEEQASQVWLETKAKRCPTCEIPCEKRSGCNHMTCKLIFRDSKGVSCYLANFLKGPRCRYEYCWLCLADYDTIRHGGNAHHRDTCYSHTNNLPGAPGHDAWLLANPRGTAGWPDRK